MESEVIPATRPKKKEQNCLHCCRIASRDIVCGRGRTGARSPGNVAHRRLVGLSLSRYKKAGKRGKMEINREIVEHVKAQPGTPRFFEKNPTTIVWEELSYKKGLERHRKPF